MYSSAWMRNIFICMRTMCICVIIYMFVCLIFTRGLLHVEMSCADQISSRVETITVIYKYIIIKDPVPVRKHQQPKILSFIGVSTAMSSVRSWWVGQSWVEHGLSLQWQPNTFPRRSFRWLLSWPQQSWTKGSLSFPPPSSLPSCLSVICLICQGYCNEREPTGRLFVQ